MTRRIFAIFMSVFFCTAVNAQMFEKMGSSIAPANEFVVGRETGKPLIKINLISGVQRPGVYHMPIGTELTEAIAYAGGAMEKADLSDITVLRRDGKVKSSLEINLERQLRRPGNETVVNDQDVVHIPVDRSIDRTMNWVSIISGLASVALAVSIIQDRE